MYFAYKKFIPFDKSQSNNCYAKFFDVQLLYALKSLKASIDKNQVQII